METRVSQVAKRPRARLVCRIVFALMGVAAFHSLSSWPVVRGSRLETAAYIADIALYVYRINDCYLFTTRSRTRATTPLECELRLAFLLEEAGVGYENPMRPGWTGLRLIRWRSDASAILVDPSKARWLFVVFCAPLVALAIGRAVDVVRSGEGRQEEPQPAPPRILRRPRLFWRIAVAALGGSAFAVLTQAPPGRRDRFETVAAIRDISVSIERISGCYFVLPFEYQSAYLHDDEQINLDQIPFDPTGVNVQLGFEYENQAAPEVSSDPRIASIQRTFWNMRRLERPGWHGFRYITWKMKTVLIIEPLKARWFTTIALVPLLLAFAGFLRRRIRRRRGRCESCGYILLGLPSAHCPECGTPCPVRPSRFAS